MATEPAAVWFEIYDKFVQSFQPIWRTQTTKRLKYNNNTNNKIINNTMMINNKIMINNT